jgi:hypothetical protein
MAAIIDDGPREWVVDTLNRKLGRVLAVVAGAAMLWSVHLLEPGRARLALAIGAGILFVRAVRPPSAGPTVEDLAEVELLVMRQHEQWASGLGEVRDDVRVICDRLSD